MQPYSSVAAHERQVCCARRPAKTFAAYLDRLPQAAGHLARALPLKSYCTGLLFARGTQESRTHGGQALPGQHQTNQSLHHVLADSPWSDEDLLEQVRRYVLPAMQKQGAVMAWVVDDTGFVNKGTHSVGVARQYCGQVGKQENCRIGVSLSLSTAQANLPIAWRLYLPEVWTEDKKRRQAAGIPEDIEVQTKPEIALEQIRIAVDRQIPSASGPSRRRLRQ